MKGNKITAKGKRVPKKPEAGSTLKMSSLLR